MFANSGKMSRRTIENSMFFSMWINENTICIPISSRDLNSPYYSVVLKAPKNALISFTAQIYETERRINLEDKKVNGVLQAGESILFTLDLEDVMLQERYLLIEGAGKEQKFIADFMINLIPYNGDPDLFVYYGERKPDSTVEYSWKSLEKVNYDLLLITADELNQKGYSPDKMFYINIVAKETTSFELRIDTYSKNSNSVIQLHQGQPVSGYLGQNQIMNYEIKVEGNVPHNIEIILTALTGNPDLFVSINDNHKDDKPITKKQIEQFYIDGPTKNNTFVGWGVKTQGVDIVKVKADPIECQKNYYKTYDMLPPVEGSSSYFNGMFGFCVFKIAVYGKNGSSKYNIQAVSKDPQTIQRIREGEPSILFMEFFQSLYFVFKPQILDTQIESISFYLEYSRGLAELSADRNLTKLKEDHYSTAFLQQVSFTLQDNVENLAAYEYYVRVKSYEKTSATLTTIIKRKGQQEITYKYLAVDSPLALRIPPHSNGYFSFSPYFTSSSIVAKADNEIKMYIGDKKYFPSSKTTNLYDADSNSASTSRIKRVHLEEESQTNFQKDAFFGTIENLSDSDVRVEIRYETDITFLEFNQSFEDILFSKSKRQFNFLIDRERCDDAAYAYVLASGFVVEQQIKGGFYINQVLISEFQDTEALKLLELGPGFYKQHCSFLFDENDFWNRCILSIDISSEKEERLTIAINVPSQPTFLHYSGSTLSQIPLKGEVRKFFKFFFDLSEVLLNVQSFSYSVIVLGRVLTQEKFNDPNYKQYAESVEDKKLSFKTEGSTSHQIRIHPNTFKGEPCTKGCYLAISVILDSNQSVTDEELLGNIIKINLSGDKIYDLYEGEIMKGEVKQDDMLYYRVYVPPEKAQDKLIVSLTPLNEGDSDLFLNKDPSKLPTRFEFDLSSQDIAGDFIQVDNQTFKDEKTNTTGIAGSYVVGVYGVSDSVFTISFQTGKHRIQKIASNQVQQVSLEENSISYFVFHKLEKGSFTVVTNILQGSSQDLYIFLKEFKEDSKIIKGYLDNIVDPNSSDQTTKFSSMKDVLRYSANDCDSCVYVIGVKNSRKVTFSISINLDSGVAQIQNNKQQLVYLLQNKPQLLRFYSNDDFSLYVTSLSGQCIDTKVTYSYGVSSSSTPMQSKLCGSSDSSNNLGYQAYQLEVIHPDKEATKERVGLFYTSIFTIELLSKSEDAKAVVQGVTGGHARLIVSSVPLTQQVSKTNNVVEFLYFTSYEDLQAVQVNISPESGESDQLEKVSLRMVVADTGKHVYQQQIALTPTLLSKSFFTSRSQYYLLKVIYSGTETFTFSILLKETTKSSLHILDGTVMDILPYSEVSNYVVYSKPSHQILIQNFNCYESQNIYVYSNSTDLFAQNQHTQSVISKSGSNHQVHIAKIDDKNDGAIYIQKRANRGSSDTISKSIITATDFLRNEPIIYDYIQIGNAGTLISIQDDENIYIDFTSLSCVSPGCFRIKNLTIQSVEYSIYIQRNLNDLHRVLNCEIKESNDLSIDESIQSIWVEGLNNFENINSRLFTIDKSILPKNIGNLFVGISAKVTVASEVQDTPNRLFRFIYNELSLDFFYPSNITPQQSSSHGVIIALSILGIAGLAVALFLLYRKYTQVSKKLKYEMTDVRNIAFSNSDMEQNSGSNSKQFSQILPPKVSELVQLAE